jgi:antirestriction protein ArdC
MANMKAAEKMADVVLEMMEKGDIVPWRKAWATSRPQNLASKHVYRGINTFVLSWTAAAKGYESNYWVTFNGAKTLGGSVRKGEKGTPIVFARMVEKKNSAADAEKKEKGRFFFYNITYAWNIAQCEGIEAPPAPFASNTPIENCEEIVRNMPNLPTINFGGEPCYNPMTDVVALPKVTYFESSAKYYRTLFHELSHATGHKSRLDRNMTTFSFEPYGIEELTAEFCSSMLTGVAGIREETAELSNGYLAGWIKAIKADKSIVMKAASAAQKAFDYITGVKAGGKAEEPETENAEAHA